jgi:hypothetical protein
MGPAQSHSAGSIWRLGRTCEISSACLSGGSSGVKAGRRATALKRNFQGTTHIARKGWLGSSRLAKTLRHASKLNADHPSVMLDSIVGGTLQEESHGRSNSHRHSLGRFAAPACRSTADSRQGNPRLAGGYPAKAAAASATSAGASRKAREQHVASEPLGECNRLARSSFTAIPNLVVHHEILACESAPCPCSRHDHGRTLCRPCLANARMVRMVTNR